MMYHLLVLSFIIASLVKVYGLKYIYSLFQWFTGGAFILAVSVWFGSEGFNLPIKVLLTDGGGGLAGNSTLTAGYFLFILAMAVFLFTVKEIPKHKKWLIGITMAVIIFSPVFINFRGFLVGNGILGSARGTILALITGIGAAGIGYMFLSGKKFVKILSITLTAVGLISFGFLWVQLITPNTYLHQKFSEQARGSRFILWDSAQKAMDKHPIFGYGPENYAIAFQEYFDPQILVEGNSFEGWADRAHNIYYELGVSGGYPALVLYAIFLLSIFYVLYILYRDGKLRRIQASILAGLLIAYLANNLFTFDSNLSLMALFILIGIIYSLKDRNDIKQKLPTIFLNQTNKNTIAFGLSVLFLASFIFLVYMPSAKSKMYAETFSAAINNRGAMYKDLLKGSSIGEDWDISGLAFDTYRKYAANPASIKADKEKLPYLIENLSALIGYLYKVSERNTTNYRLYITIAYLENTLTYMTDAPYDKERQDKILGILEKAKSLSPRNPNTYWGIAQVKAWNEDFVGVEQAYRDAIAIDPTFPSSYKLLLRFAQAFGNQKLYNEIILQAEKNIPGFSMK